MGLILGKRDLKLAKHAVKCYYGLDDGDGKIDIIENFDKKMPTGGLHKRYKGRATGVVATKYRYEVQSRSIVRVRFYLLR